MGECLLEFLIYNTNIKNNNKIKKVGFNFNLHTMINKFLKLKIIEKFDTVIIIQNKILFYQFENEKDH